MSEASRHSDEVLAQALQALAQAGAIFVEPASRGSKSLASAAAFLDLSPGWLRTNLQEFPHWYRLPAGTSNGRSVGEIRIPVRDLEEFERRRQKARVIA